MKFIDEWLTRPGGLCERLRAVRKAAGLTGPQMAAQLGWVPSKISKLETGRQMAAAEDITAWAQACGIDQTDTQELHRLLAEAQGIHTEWRHHIRIGQVAVQRSYDELTRESTLIRNAEVTFIPGLLQVPDYARRRFLEGVERHGGNPAEVEAATAVRLQRQQVLYDTSKRFEFVITETVLRILLCSRAVMLSQLDRLLALTAGMSNVYFGIIPFGVELSMAPQNGFILFDNQLAAVETYTNETMHHGDEAAAYAAVMDRLVQLAWTGDQARQLLIDAMQALRSGEPDA